MLVCICNPTSDTKVSEESLKCNSVDQVIFNLKICQNCKRCSSEIRKIFKQNNKP